MILFVLMHFIHTELKLNNIWIKNNILVKLIFNLYTLVFTKKNCIYKIVYILVVWKTLINTSENNFLITNEKNLNFNIIIIFITT